MDGSFTLHHHRGDIELRPVSKLLEGWQIAGVRRSVAQDWWG